MHRVFVEKQPPFATKARSLLRELRESLNLGHLEHLRCIQRYDLEGLQDEEFAEAIRRILSEPQVDVVTQSLELKNGEHVFAVEYLPGQFDQRADSAAQCIQILTGRERPRVISAQVYVVAGALEAGELEQIKSYIINAVDSHEAAMEPPETLSLSAPRPADVAVLDEFSARPPAEIRQSLQLAMSEEDIALCQRYFRDEERRAPTITEIRMLDTYWSDHCRHTTFLTRIDQVTFDAGTGPIQRAWQTYQSVREALGRGEKPVTLMDLALTGMRELRDSGELDNLEESEEINAASIIVPVSIDGADPEEWLVQFKNETHNHPTEIEPFGGAATCLGGCIRDPLSGRAYVYQAMRVTGAADPLAPFGDTLPGKLPQRKICQVAAHGYASYGNQIGLATGQVAEVYHPGYLAKRMEIGAVVAAAPRRNVFRGSPATGDLILLIGGRTGRDGVGGATGSSKEHDSRALENSAEVQKGDAPTERKIQRLFRNAELARKIKICNDFGAGGVAVAIGEIAPSLDIDLDAVPKKYEGLDGTELAISESQERMAVCVDPADHEFFVAACEVENLECSLVARVADHGRLRMTWRGQGIVDLSRSFLDTNGVQQSAAIHVAGPRATAPAADPRPLPERLADLRHCSQQGLGEMFDGSVGAGTVLWPFGGSHQLTPPEAMVAKLPLLEGHTDICTHMSWAYDPYRSSDSPFHGAAWAVTESVLKCVASGARLEDVRLTLQEYFPKLGNDPVRWGLPLASLLGAFDAQHGLRLAAIGGKDSMSGSFNELDVPPTLVSFAVAPGTASLALSPEFKQTDSFVSIIPVAITAEDLPDYAAIRATAAAIHQAHQQTAFLSIKYVGAAGIGVALAVCAFGNRIGFRQSSGHPDLDQAFGPAAFLVEHEEPLDPSLQAVEIGRTTAKQSLVLASTDHALDALVAVWTGTLESVYPTSPGNELPVSATLPLATQSPVPRSKQCSNPGAVPRVLIPAFPGTNSEYDSAKAFREAGAESEILVLRNQTPRHLEESLAELAQRIRQSQILCLPGGFSAGDEPDGSAKFITAVLQHPEIADAIMDLLRQRDGLILGICNGFQALIKTGLVPFGEIRAPSPEAPTLCHNDIGRHVSRYTRTRVCSTLSPWFAASEVGDIHWIPVSHGEGKFIAPPEVLQSLAASGQIAAQDRDDEGRPTLDPTHNPNGSYAAIEGITSPCGRILGKMGHSERRGDEVAKNIPDPKDQPLFRAGVAWFQ